MCVSRDSGVLYAIHARNFKLCDACGRAVQRPVSPWCVYVLHGEFVISGWGPRSFWYLITRVMRASRASGALHKIYAWILNFRDVCRRNVYIALCISSKRVWINVEFAPFGQGLTPYKYLSTRVDARFDIVGLPQCRLDECAFFTRRDLFYRMLIKKYLITKKTEFALKLW